MYTMAPDPEVIEAAARVWLAPRALTPPEPFVLG
jgi:hypothetical protein